MANLAHPDRRSHPSKVLPIRIDMAAAGPVFGHVDVISQPSGARVSLDGNAAGQTPLELRSVAAGRHVIGVFQGATVVNRTVEVVPGAAVSVFVSLARQPPNGNLFGSTPLGNVPIAVGTRQIVWRHPLLGERRRTVVAGAQTPVRVAVDLTW